MTKDKFDVTDRLFEKEQPWDTIDKALEVATDIFAAIGMMATVAFLVGYLWGWFK
jgi:hypothetical protein